VQVIPVIDLKQGLVVRGVGGRRDEYRPIESRLAADALPGTVGMALADLGFRTTYLADLDAIESSGTLHDERSPAMPPCAWPVYENLLRAGLALWVDAGLATADQARELGAFRVEGRGVAAVVAGLESLRSPRELAEMVRLVGQRRLVFSLDLKGGVPLAREAAWRGLNAEQIAVLALRGGVRRMIVLDLAAVGMGQGAGTEPLCRTLRMLAPELELIAGGGVRGPRDLVLLERAGCDAALVASALHDGRLDARRAAASQ
jgi:phosphoribosylformimino-5-aminoimidazole carboxamide ribotide isomerase